MMNELIRELADKARFVKTTDYPSQDEVFEKFAELIVRECANQCLSDDSMRILNHMGVKYE